MGRLVRGRSLLPGGLLLLSACAPSEPPRPDDRPEAAPAAGAELPAPAGPVVFEDRAAELGIRFEHFAGLTGRLYLGEVVAPGAALFDADGDGDLDVYLAQGNLLAPGEREEDLLLPPPGPLPLSDRLYRNELAETGRLAFTDVTAASGLRPGGYSMGLAVGDIDGDGDPDLHVTALDENRLLENLGGLRFRDVTSEAGVTESRWSTASAFLDYDRDGDLDLFVGNYVDFSIARHKPCQTASGAPDYCGPLSYSPLPLRLFRNRGDGRFDDVTAPAGLDAHQGALGVLARDFDGDGWIDVYVANDGRPNQLWRNQGDGRFRDEALVAGCAFNADGVAEASMGVDAADFDGDGDDDLFLTHLTAETNTLYVNDGRGRFEDRTFEARLGMSSQPFTSFGTAWIDFDGDGWLDLFVANGMVRVDEAQRAAGIVPPLEQPNQLFRNLGGGAFEEVGASAGASFAVPEVSRGVAVGDVDQDGDLDVLLTNNSGPTRLLVNQLGQKAHWLGLRLLEREGAWDALGARAGCLLPDGKELWRAVRADGSYLSASDPRVLFGLGGTESVQRVRVRWSDGSRESWPWSGRPIDAYQTLVRGTGEPEP